MLVVVSSEEEARDWEKRRKTEMGWSACTIGASRYGIKMRFSAYQIQTVDFHHMLIKSDFETLLS